jgi:hypothetical protein
MANPKPFLIQTVQTASFALREYFRPLVVAGRFLKSGLIPNVPADSTPKKKCQEPIPDRKSS